jgi:hypothetical protein
MHYEVYTHYEYLQYHRMYGVVVLPVEYCFFLRRSDKDLLSLRYTVTRNYCKVKYHTVIH